MINIYKNETDLLISKVVRFGTGKPIGSLWKSHNLEKMAPNSGRWQEGPNEAQKRRHDEDIINRN